MGKTGRTRWIGFAVLAANFLLAALLVYLFYTHNTQYEEKIRQQNLENIQNLNTSSTQLAMKYYDNQEKSLSRVAQYLVRHETTMDGVLELLSDLDIGEGDSYEVIDADFQGYYSSITRDRSDQTLDYGSKAYRDMQSVIAKASEADVGEVGFIPEFTDKRNGVKSLGLYTTIPVLQEDGTREYMTLISMIQSRAFSEAIQMEGEYRGLSTGMFNQKGNYIISTDTYKSDNFFQYLYVYNNLTLDEKNEIAEKVAASESGTLYYKNGSDQKSVFVYSRVSGKHWYVVTEVPLEQFIADNQDYRFTLYTMVILVTIFGVDMLWMRAMNRRLKDSMEHERKANSAKSDFLARMSHDIRTPLNAVIGFSNLASEEQGLSASVADALGKINSSGKYLLGLINDILDMSKIENNKFEIHETLENGPEFLRGIADIFKAQADQKGIHLVTDFSGATTQWVYMDALRSRQIYSNLLNNALKYSEPGTTITWKITDTLLSPERMRMVCTIADQGCGMSAEFMKHLFKPFEQELNKRSEKEGGTGLGLAIVKNLVELMGGTIEVESELGRGSTFIITMERRVGQGKSIEAECEKLQYEEIEDRSVAMKGAESELEDIFAGKRILLCEDHPLNREIAVRLLEKKEMLVECAENGQEGLEKFESSAAGDYDLILMDIRMPVMDGIQVSKAIRALERTDAATVPILAMTANAFEDDIQECIEAGMNGHLSKPVDPKVMYEKIKEQLKRKK